MEEKEVQTPLKDYIIMGYHPRIESSIFISFITVRCAQSRMWFLHNRKLEEKILAHVAKYSEIYGVKIYALAIEGNHLHFLAGFPNRNRGPFMKSLNSSIANLVNRYCETFEGGRVFGRRYSYEIVPPDSEDVEDRFFYTALQQVQDGLARKLSEYKYYNCFNDAARGKTREYKLIDWARYNRANRGKKKVDIKEFETTYVLKYEKIPGYEDLTQGQYFAYLSQILEKKTVAAVQKRLAEGKGFATQEELKRTVPGSKPRVTKKSERYSFRPRVLSVCPKRRAHWKKFYFDCYYEYKRASEKFRRGALNVIFPPGMYKPWLAPA